MEEPTDTTEIHRLPVSSRRKQVAEFLREEIVTGRLEAGSQMKQDQIGHTLGVSPGPVREALRDLESEGLVEHIPNRGVFVSEVTREDLLGVLLPVRLAIESFAADRVLDNGELLARLQDLVAEMRRSADRGELKRLNELDLRFHETVVNTSGSSHAIQLWTGVQSRIRLQIHRLSPRHLDMHDIAEEHQQLLNALSTNDRAIVVAVLTDHILGSAHKLMDADDARAAQPSVPPKDVR